MMLVECSVVDAAIAYGRIELTCKGLRLSAWITGAAFPGLFLVKRWGLKAILKSSCRLRFVSVLVTKVGLSIHLHQFDGSQMEGVVLFARAQAYQRSTTASQESPVLRS